MVRTAHATVAWSNRRLPFNGGTTALLDECAWHIPVRGDIRSSANISRTFYAECYGGDGIHHNGGGARCGWHHPWIVKGIGINLLSGYSDEDAASYRNNGRASLSEMCVEAIWGEVLQYALPFGAVRMTAVIHTGELITGGNRSLAGIGVREFVWRPAHFMKAPGFHVRPENRSLIPSDTSRVKEAIARLPDKLPPPASMAAYAFAKLGPVERLTLGMEEMIRRFAEQMAAAKAKRLSHGTLSTSNVSLDGRWNDLNSVSALPGFGFRRNMTPFWTDQVSLQKSIEMLCFYVQKYFPRKDLGPLPNAAWLSKVYENSYEDALTRRFVGLCGYPHNVSNKIWQTPTGQQSMRDLADILVALAKSGYSPRRPFEDEMQNNRVRGDYQLTKILKTISVAKSAEDADARIIGLMPSKAVRQLFIRHYMIVKHLMFEEANWQGVNDNFFSRLAAINCAKADRNITSLYRNVLFTRCDEAASPDLPVESLAERVTDLAEPLIDEARMVYEEAINFTTLLWCRGSETVSYDAHDGKVVVSLDDNGSPHSPGRDLAVSRNNAIRSMETYWGSELKEIMR